MTEKVIENVFRRRYCKYVIFSLVSVLFFTLIGCLQYSSRSVISFPSSNFSKILTQFNRFYEPIRDESSDQPSITISNEGRTFSVRTREFDDDQNMVLIVNNLGRSGSSWVGNLLSLVDDNTIYLYEPLLMLDKILRERKTSYRSVEILSDIFRCQAQRSLTDLYHEWEAVLSQVREKCGEECITINDYNNVCKNSESIVVKVIRLHLSEVEKFLSSKRTQHMKIIYLVRDPRAQIYSRIQHLRVGPDHSPITDCQEINAGILSFHKLSRLYPGHLYFLRYEDMSRNPMAEAEKLWKFLNTDHDGEIPDSWRQYIEFHNRTPRKETAFTINRDSSTEWYKWRTEFNPKNLSLPMIERECKTVMSYAGYIPLRNMENLRNLDVDFLTDVDCDYLNCWSFRY